jgi:3-dehydroquinate dehydratase/shikimate dehydrogenase
LSPPPDDNVINDRPKICASVVESTPAEAARTMAEASPWADLFEWRLDFLSRGDLKPRLEKLPGPLILTCRPEWDGGRFMGDETERADFMGRFFELSPDYVDVELKAGPPVWDAVRDRPDETGLIVSLHLWESTPPEAFLSAWFQRLSRTEADVMKLVTRAKNVEDNLRVLSLIGQAGRRGLIAFCAGRLGQWSRVAAPLLGSPWTYAPARADAPTAPGQIAGPELRLILDQLT